MRFSLSIASMAFVGFALLGNTAAHAQSFTCGFNKRAACLEYGDQVCSTYAKCVDANAVCFDQFQCNYEGFTCKSNVSECAEKFENLIVSKTICIMLIQPISA